MSGKELRQSINIIRSKTIMACACFAALLAISCLYMPGSMQTVSAATTVGTNYSGNNVNAQDYGLGWAYWSSPVSSYLCYENGQIMRMQEGYNIPGVLVEYYNSSTYVMNESRIVAQDELPLFGGFYSTDSYYFIVTGQNNPNESDDLEVFRITKYDKNWNRLGSVGLYGANTTIPFRAGSLRMTTCGKYLLIRTSHQMYKYSDGLNHQANVTIEVDMEKMVVTDSYTDIMNSDYGYVSHSFNQFIKVEDNHIIAVDHGDAHPRSIALIKYQTDASTGKFAPEGGYYDFAHDEFYSDLCEVTDVLSFPGATGQNQTGASVGGVEISSSSYLVAGDSVVQDSNNLRRTTKNIFIASVSKETGETNINWLTNYEEGAPSTTTPHLVKIDDTLFMVFWSVGDTVFYAFIDENGDLVGRIQSMAGKLSDCVPIATDTNIVWYVWEGNNVTFYELPLPPSAEARKLIQDFVTRPYDVCLDRTPDPTGLKDWAGRLICGEETGSEVASGFVFSDEFRDKNLCNEHYITYLYNAMMGRGSDAVGLAYWLECLESGQTREEVFNGFVVSDEFTGICVDYGVQRGDGIPVPQYGTVPTGACSVCGRPDGVTSFVRRLYSLCLDRDAEPDGLAYWCSQLWEHTNSGRGVAYGFVSSPEFTGKELSDEQFVEYMYRVFLDREFDAFGKDYWMNNMANGWSREQVFDGFVDSEEFDSICRRYGIMRE